MVVVVVVVVMVTVAVAVTEASRLFRRIKLQVFMDGVSLCTEVSVEGSCLRGIMLWCTAVCCALPGRVRAPCSVLRTRYYVCCAMYAVLCSLYSVVCTRQTVSIRTDATVRT